MITLLCVTHNRPKWIPWLLAQHRKLGFQLTIVASGEWDSYFAMPNVTVERVPNLDGIAVKRNIALEAVKTPFFAWLDDDDWAHPRRLSTLLTSLEDCAELTMAGSTRGYKINSHDLSAKLYHTVEPVIFNSALYRTSHWQRFRFNEKLVAGEDTDWQKRGTADGSLYARTDNILMSWMCHNSNISNRQSLYTFDDREPALLRDHIKDLKTNPMYRGDG